MWDELRAPAGSLREPWRHFADWLPPPAGLGLAADLDHRVGQVAAQIRMDGVTHNVFDDRGAASRPWSLELLPLLIEPADWAAIEAGVVQRARLLEHMLDDLYGPRRLLAEGLLPPALVLRHPGYLRPMIGARAAGRPATAHRRLRPGARPTKAAGGWWRSARRARRGWATCCTTAS